MAIISAGATPRYNLQAGESLSIITDSNSSCRYGQLPAAPSYPDVPAVGTSMVAVPASSTITVGQTSASRAKLANRDERLKSDRLPTVAPAVAGAVSRWSVCLGWPPRRFSIGRLRPVGNDANFHLARVRRSPGDRRKGHARSWTRDRREGLRNGLCRGQA